MPSLLKSVALCGLASTAAGYSIAMPPRSAVVQHSRTAGVQMMPSPETIAKKATIVDEVVETMEGSMLMFCVRSEGIPVNEMNILRQQMPEGTTIRCVKNTLVKRAAEQVPKFQGGDDLLVRSNYWFFCPEEDMRETFKTWNEYVEKSKKEENDIVGGVFEGECLDKKGVEAVTKLPTKQELMQSTAILLKAIPTKLARSLNEAGAQRIAKVTKQAAAGKLVNAVKQLEVQNKLP